MTTHGCIDKVWHSIPTGLRRWVNTQKTKWSFELNFGHRYTTIGIDISDEEHLLSGHFAVPGLWASAGFVANWSWARSFQTWFNKKFGYGGRSFQISYFEHTTTYEFFKMDGNDGRRVPWWQRQSVRMPWHSQWVSTELLTLDLGGVVWRDDRKNRKNWSDNYDAKKSAEKQNSLVTDYTYVRKNGEVQKRLATVHVTRMAWGFLWLPLPLKKRTSINVDFDGEVGEGTGSWKGGTLGCGYTMRAEETAMETLRRMERERKFDR